MAIPASDNARRNAQAVSQLDDFSLGAAFSYVRVVFERNEELRGELVGSDLAFVLSAPVVDEQVLLAVVEHMPGLVKEGEPEDVFDLAPEAKQDHGLVRGQPPGGPVPGNLLHLGDQRDRHACVSAEAPELRLEDLGWLPGKRPDVLQGELEAFPVERLTFYALGLQLALAYPCGRMAGPGLEAGRPARGDGRAAPDGFPGRDRDHAKKGKRRMQQLGLVPGRADQLSGYQLLGRYGVQPFHVSLKPLQRLLLAEQLAVLRLQGVPESGGVWRHHFQTNRRVRRDGLVALEDTVQGLRREACSLRQLLLRHA